MINGEGAEGKLLSECDLLFDRDSDGGDGLSHYSSCGESDFEKYCGASSAIGTPSFHSLSYQDSDFGSLKSFKLGGENSKFKNFESKKLSSGFGEFECGTCPDKGAKRSSDWNDSGIFNATVEGSFANFSDVADNWENGGLKEIRSLGTGESCTRISHQFREIKEEKGFCGKLWRNDQEEGLETLGDEVRRLSDEASSKCEHSDGEDSMFGCGTDDDSKIDSYYRKNVLTHGKKLEKNENNLVMNSQVAFGSDDWDDFIHENGESTSALLVWNDLQSVNQHSVHSVTDNWDVYASETDSVVILAKAHNVVRNTDYDQVHATSKLKETNVNALSTDSNQVKLETQGEYMKEVMFSRNQASDVYETAENFESHYGYVLELDKEPLTKKVLENGKLKIHQTESEIEHKYSSRISSDISLDAELGATNITLDPFSESAANHPGLVSMKDIKGTETILSLDKNPLIRSSLADAKMNAPSDKNSALSFDQVEDHFELDKKREIKLNVFYDEIVDDMEDILLDPGDTPGSRYSQSSRTYQSQFARPSRDGGASASISGIDYAHNWIQQPKIDRLEVVGARQIEGGVSLSERLVGVKKYTVYKIRVWSGENHWEVERRYRDFNTLYHQLKKLFGVQECTLPSPWSFVDRESRKLFGNASPDAVADRSVLIQECLQSVIDPKFPSSSLAVLIGFLSPSELPISLVDNSNTNAPMSTFPNRGTLVENFSSLGKTISLNVHILPFKSTKQLLDIQHYRCAGCHRNFDDGRSRVLEYFKALGWGQPRLCEYTGQLFCTSCHSNDTAVLPARVLHNWDFTRYPVSQMAKSYLDSIYDQPMLCLSAVNPFLFSKVPALQQVANIRNRIRVMLPYVRCPFRRSIDKGLGSRGYLVTSNDFFSLRDLIDLSKGIFSALPVMLETVLRKIQEHITEQCLVCYDVGIPCNARQACNNPLSLIFPFQKEDVEKCISCGLVFHKKCFKTIDSCHCGARIKQEEMSQHAGGQEGQESGSGLLSGLFSKVTPRMTWSYRKQELEDVGNVILMGSLSNSSL